MTNPDMMLRRQEAPPREMAIGLGVAAVGLTLGLGLGTIASNQPAIERIVEAYDGTSQLEDNVRSFMNNFVEDDLRVNCDGDESMSGPDLITNGYVMPAHLLSYTHYPDVITLSPAICQDIERAEITRTLDQESAAATLVASHEYEHIALKSSDEAEVSCRAVAKFASRLENVGLEKSYALNYTMSTAQASYLTAPPEYIDTINCSPGGKYLADLETAGHEPIVYYNYQYLFS
ncbi:MAG: hypothetical protein UY35_C0001G0090 [Candidatus Saccharibacteria bacterium GW2011_GWC2_48_9]|nr:MAG: hypothetical protein UY35_C0001G0090 [Candidatus Saccharibacteria bacterium GW2011_GWC2_48_9]HCH34741.1 hypothetical protein [Candidatus Saccharibacteria bacterium]